MRDRLIELIEKEVPRPKADALAGHLLANGVIVPPCKVGDTMYKINGNLIEKIKVARFVISSYGIRAEDLYGVQVVFIEDFGKTVFLTKEEAEAKLKECEG